MFRDPRHRQRLTRPTAHRMCRSWLAAEIKKAITDIAGKDLFDVLTDYVIFGQFVFYLLAVAALFVLRVRRPDLPRPYKTFGYPWLPLVFVLGSLGFLFGMFGPAPWNRWSDWRSSAWA